MSSVSFQKSTHFSGFGINNPNIFQDPNSAQADVAINGQTRLDTGVEKRNGFQAKVFGKGGYGSATYEWLNSDGTTTFEQLLMDTSLWRLKTGTLNISYTGTHTRACVSVTVQNGTMYLDIVENSINILHKNLGQGFEDSIGEILSSTLSSITALTGFAGSTITGDNSIPSAFLDITEEISVPVGTIGKINFFYVQEVNKTVDIPFDGLKTRLNTDDITNVNWTNHQGLLIFADGSHIKVYDGQTIYKGGLPAPPAPIVDYISIAPIIDTVSTSPTYNKNIAGVTGDWTYYLTYNFLDNQGKLTESDFSDPIDMTNLVNNGVSINVTPLKQGSGYNTNCSIMNGNQAVAPSAGLVTLNTYIDRNSLKAGDSAYLYNRTAGINEHRTYKVSSVTTTTIVLISSDTITVNDLDPASNNLSINIYRQEDSSAIRYLVRALPNNSYVISQSYTDVINDITTLPNYLGDVTITQNEPPISDYCASYNGNLMLSKGQILVWSDETQPLVNTSGLSFRLSTYIQAYNDIITGLMPSYQSLIIFQRARLDSITASNMNDFSTITQQVLSYILGCPNQTCIGNIGTKVFFLNKFGIYEVENGSILVSTLTYDERLAAKVGLGDNLALPVSSYFDDPNRFVWKRAMISAEPVYHRMLITLPNELTGNPGRSTSNSVTLVYEIKNATWYEWTNFDISGGVNFDSDLNTYFCERRSSASQRIVLNRFFREKRPIHYNDHINPINFEYTTNWINFGLPSAKNIEKLKVYSVRSRPQDSLHNTTFDVTIFADYVDNLLHSQLTFDLENQGQPWGFRWEAKPYGSYKSSMEFEMLKRESVESIKITFKNNAASTNINLTGWVLQFVPREN